MNDFLFSNLQGTAKSETITITGKGKFLPDLPCKLVMLSNLSVEDSQALTNAAAAPTDTNEQIFYGFSGFPAHQIQPFANSNYIPVKNCNQIFVRCKSGQTKTIWFSYFN